MKRVNINESDHDFEKLNLVTLKGGGDLLKCKNCGMKGKTKDINGLYVNGNYKNPQFCKAVKTDTSKKRIKITFCTANGKVFKNLKPDSIHETVSPPPPYKEDKSGVWVMGVGEPVKVLNNEFILV